MQVATDQLVSPGDDVDRRQHASGLEGHVAASGNLAQDLDGLRGDGLHVRKLVPEDLQRKVGAGAGHHLIEAHLDGLGEHSGLPGNGTVEKLGHQLDEPRLGDR